MYGPTVALALIMAHAYEPLVVMASCVLPICSGDGAPLSIALPASTLQALAKSEQVVTSVRNIRFESFIIEPRQAMGAPCAARAMQYRRR